MQDGLLETREKIVEPSETIPLVDDLFSGVQGYLEVRHERSEYPALLVGFRGDFAVVQCVWEPESMGILLGDGIAPTSELVDVLIMDEFATFAGEYVSSCVRAREILSGFVSGADVPGLEWHEL